MRRRFLRLPALLLSSLRSAIVFSLLLVMLPDPVAADSGQSLVGSEQLSPSGGQRPVPDASPLPTRQVPGAFSQSPTPQPPVEDEAGGVTVPVGAATPEPAQMVALDASLPAYRQGAAEVRQNRATIETLASDQVPEILLAASIANQGNTYQRPLGVDWGERVQVVFGLGGDPSVGIGQIMPGEAKRYGYAGDVWGLFEDEVSIGLMAAKLQRTESAVDSLHLAPTESFILVAIGNNMGDTVVTNSNRFRQYGTISGFLKNDEEARTQLLKMMNWMEYLQANEGWSFPKGVDTNRIWQLLWDAHE
ncbi:MAG: hypothetical protein HY328_10735 [Chloroflexi bacterium]|nr:hypothetical protein [Chloroflexota bacterium]